MSYEGVVMCCSQISLPELAPFVPLFVLIQLPFESLTVSFYSIFVVVLKITKAKWYLIKSHLGTVTLALTAEQRQKKVPVSQKSFNSHHSE